MSFISVEPQSRVFLESHSNSLLTQFDIQLEIISDRYLAFFRERRKIEISYISSLRKLHREATAVDAPFDPRTEPTTTRAAWDKVRDSLEAEANTQQTFVDVLDNDVIKPLAVLKEVEDQTRKRVEEGLEESAAKYADHTENTILKLQQAYLKKHHPRQYSQDGPNKRSGNADGRQEDLGGREPSESKEGVANITYGSQHCLLSSPSEFVSEDDYKRAAVALLNSLRLKRVENLGDGYECLEKLVFSPIVKDVLLTYMATLVAACTNRGNLAINTGAEVEKALVGADTSGLKAFLDHALSLSIPPLALYCNYRPNAHSTLIFGAPLVNLTTDQDNVPKVIRMCIEEVEKRGLNTRKIYSVGSIYDADILRLRHRFESEQSFSFGPTDDIHSVAMLLKLYLRDLPEPLFMLSLKDCRQYLQNRASYTENNCSILRSMIRESHPIHRASLEAVLQHLLLVASHSDKNEMSVEALASQFCYTVLRGSSVFEGGVHAKARNNDFVKLVMEDLIENARTLFDEHPQPPATGWRLPHPGHHQHPEAPTIRSNRPDSVLSSASDFSLSTASSISGAEFPPSPTESLQPRTTESPPLVVASLSS
ncbi:Rho GTPase activation protein [Lactarius indigo]|nr:Rho GTPase activation protein [Lactarius indigo]